MRARFAVTLVLIALGVIGACGKAPAPNETLGSGTGPPITVCYEPDGAPCPPPDGGSDGSADGAIDDARREGG